MSDMSAFWIVWSFGFGVGFVYRIWGERNAARHDAPAWIVALGYSLCRQFKSVETGHKFAGNEVEVTSTLTYSYTDGSGRFSVKVRAEEPVDA